MTVVNGFSAGLVPMIIIGNVRWLDVPKGDECIPTLCGATFSNKCFNSASRTDTKTLLSHTCIYFKILIIFFSFVLFCFVFLQHIHFLAFPWVFSPDTQASQVNW